MGFREKNSLVKDLLSEHKTNFHSINLEDFKKSESERLIAAMLQIKQTVNTFHMSNLKVCLVLVNNKQASTNPFIYV